jgi:hypothetical protein
MCAQPRKAANNATSDRRRRRHARYYTDFPVGVTMLGGDGYKRIEAHSKDLSEAGIGILVADELVLGEVFSLEFSLPDATSSWEVRAVLRHRRGYHYGFEFLSLTRPQAELLMAFLQKQVRTDTYKE